MRGSLKLFAFLLCLFAADAALAGDSKDTTKRGMARGMRGLFFKRHFDFNNRGAEKRFARDEDRSSWVLAMPFDTVGYRLTFRDDFDSLNGQVWQIGQPWGRFHEGFPHQYYGDSEVVIENGILKLYNRYAPKVVRGTDSNYLIPYGTGLINTSNSAIFTYGYFAIRSKNPRGPATWPAFWLTGKYHWPPEIDIFEMYGRCSGEDIHEQRISVHFGKIENHTKRTLTKSVRLTEDTDTNFHIYSCLWEPGKMTFYTDGVLLKTITLNPWMEQFYKEPMFIILNNAVDHRYLGCIRPGDMPSTFEVDWIRVYQKKP